MINRSMRSLPRALALALPLTFFAAGAGAQAPTAATAAPAAASPAEKELVARLLKLQQPAIESLARQLAEQPAGQLLNQAGAAMQARVAPEKREATATAIRADVKKYTDEAVPLVRERAIKLAPATVGKLLEERFTEDELKQIVSLLESPVYAKYMQTSGEMQKALLEKLVADTRPAIEPKIRVLEASVGKRLGMSSPATAAAPGAASAPAKKPAQ